MLPDLIPTNTTGGIYIWSNNSGDLVKHYIKNTDWTDLINFSHICSIVYLLLLWGSHQPQLPTSLTLNYPMYRPTLRASSLEVLPLQRRCLLNPEFLKVKIMEYIWQETILPDGENGFLGLLEGSRPPLSPVNWLASGGEGIFQGRVPTGLPNNLSLGGLSDLSSA